MSVHLPYSMDIRWSDEDQVYIAHLVEFGEGAKTHGATYEEAARMGTEVLEGLIESYMALGDSLPVPRKYVDSPAMETAKVAVRSSQRTKVKSFRNVKVKSNGVA